MGHPNSPKAYKHPDFVTSQINIVKDLGVIEECLRKDLHCILGMDVESKSDGKLRLIINGHCLVAYELPQKIQNGAIWKEGTNFFSGCSHEL